MSEGSTPPVLLTISFTNTEYGVTKVHPDKLHEIIDRYIEIHGADNIFINEKPYYQQRNSDL